MVRCGRTRLDAECRLTSTPDAMRLRSHGVELRVQATVREGIKCLPNRSSAAWINIFPISPGPCQVVGSALNFWHTWAVTQPRRNWLPRIVSARPGDQDCTIVSTLVLGLVFRTTVKMPTIAVDKYRLFE